MSTLLGEKIKDTYFGLIKTTDNAELPLSGVQTIGDGTGNLSSLSVGRENNGIVVSGNIVASGAISGRYPSTDGAKLDGIEDGAEVNVNADWNATSGDAEILNKPSLFDGDFLSLTNKPTTISVQQATDISTNNSKIGITTGQADAIVANTAKTGITTEQANAITANTSKVGITTQQAADIVTNNSKNSYPSGDSTKVGFISVTQAVDLDTIESNVATNNAKTGITAQQATDISTNNAKVGITTTQANNITTNNAKVGITSQQANDITANNAKISFDSTSSTKLAGIAENATNVTNNNQITNSAGYVNEAAQTIHTNAIGNAIDFSARVTLDGGVAEGTSGIIKSLQNIL